MNLREGTRRLALLLGAIGAILGGFASYSELRTVLNQRARYNKFEQLAASDVVRQEHNCIMGILSESGCTEHLHGDKWDKYIVSPSYPNAKRISLPNGEIRDYPSSMNDEQISNILNKEFPTDSKGVLPQPTGGIKAINWSQNYGVWRHDYRVESIETEDGLTLYPTPSPAAWTYLLIALFPILGFFLPWGTIRVIVWVGAGFVQPSK
jgi:hypothetical protein